MFDDFMSGMSWSLPSFDLGLGGFDLSSLTGFGKDVALPPQDIAASASAALPGAAGPIASATPAPVTDYSTSFKGWGGQQNPVASAAGTVSTAANDGGIFGKIADIGKIFGPFVQGYMGMQQLAAYKKYQDQMMKEMRRQYQNNLELAKWKEDQTRWSRYGDSKAPDRNRFAGLYSNPRYEKVA